MESSGESYTPPKWAGSSDGRYSLEEIKEGVICNEHQFDKTRSFCLVGSDPSVNHILYLNPTVSRHHAVLQFDTSGNMHCYDRSRYGTFLNKARLAPHTYTQINEGDQLVFGDPKSSKRIFVVCDVSREETNDTPQDQKIQDNGKENIDAEDVNLSDDDVGARIDRFMNFETGFLLPHKIRMEVKLTNRQEALLNDFEIKLLKFSKNMAAKDQTSEQELALEPNCDELEDEVIAAQNDLGTELGWDACIISQSRKASKKMRKAFEALLFDEEDEFFDRSDKKEVKDKKGRRVEDEKSLSKHLAKLEYEYSVCDSERIAYEDGLVPISDINDDADPLDSYMRNNEEALRCDRRQGFENRKKKLKREMSRIEQLLSVVRP